MSEKVIVEPTPEQFGIFWKYLSRPEVTDVDYNGKKLWITDLEQEDIVQMRRYRKHLSVRLHTVSQTVSINSLIMQIKY